jgi:hypothetical protein
MKDEASGRLEQAYLQYEEFRRISVTIVCFFSFEACGNSNKEKAMQQGRECGVAGFSRVTRYSAELTSVAG